MRGAPVAFGVFGMNEHLMQTYARLPVAFARGEGVRLWDTDGKECLDALSGIAVCSLGHANPAVSEALCAQAGELVHTSNLYGIENQSKLGDALCRLSGMDKAFFSNSGAEANEAAIKLARLYGSQKGVADPAIVVMEGAFHGRTLATLSATGNRKIQAGFEPLVSGFNRVPYNDLEAVQRVAENNPNVVAVLVEPVQGENGVRIPDAGYLAGLRENCDANGWLLMLDEIQTGMCRTGRWFAFQHEDILPDVMTLAKALGNGVPIGACLAHGVAADVLGPGTHGSTFGGNPLMCRAALAVVDVMESDNLADRAEALGQRFADGLSSRIGGLDAVSNIRHKGLMIAVDFDRETAPLVKIALDHGVLVNATAGNVMRLLPPLVATDEEADAMIERIVAAVKEFLQ